MIDKQLKSKKTLEFCMRDDLLIKADAWGNPKNRPVILSHGGGQTRHAWGGTATELAKKGWYAVAYDHRGHGESGWSPSGDYQLDQFASDLQTIAAQFNQLPAVVGASLGGLSAMIVEGESDQRIFSSVVLVDITPRMNQEGALNIMRFMESHLKEGFANLDEAADVIAMYTQRPKKEDLSGLAKNLRLGEDGRYRWHWDPEFMAMKTGHGVHPGRLEDAVRNMGLPMLLVRGRQSELVTQEVAQQFLDIAPHAKYVDVEKARHMVAGDRNDIFTTAVIEFLEDL